MFKRDPFRPPPSVTRLLERPGLTVGLLRAGQARAGDTTPAQQLARFSAQAGAPGNADRGKAFFTTTHGGEWSCSSWFECKHRRFPPGLDKRYQSAFRDDRDHRTITRNTPS